MSSLTLPEDLLIEILTKLPVEPLLRCRAVCKTWLSLISSASFIKTHLHRIATNPNKHSFIVHSFQPMSFPNHITSLLHLNSLEHSINLDHPCPNSISSSGMEVVGSCNGLLCLTTESNRIYLWNPGTKQVKDISNFTIAVLDTTAEVSTGFGFDNVTNDYKVVRIVWASRSLNFPGRVEVYSLSKGSWREIEVELEFEMMQGSCQSIVNGFAYWVAMTHRWDIGGMFFLSFDMHNEVFQKIPRPDSNSVGQGIFHFMVEFKESLAVIVCNRNEDRNLVANLWAMDDDCGGEGSWTKKLSVGPFTEKVRVVACLKTGEIVVEKNNGRELSLYDPVSRETKRTQVQMRTYGVYNYVESLVKLN